MDFGLELSLHVEDPTLRTDSGTNDGTHLGNCHAGSFFLPSYKYRLIIIVNDNIFTCKTRRENDHTAISYRIFFRIQFILFLFFQITADNSVDMHHCVAQIRDLRLSLSGSMAAEVHFGF